MNSRLDYLHDKAKNIPLQPGVYIMKNKAGDIIYIGKAKLLKNRVSSYFRSVEKHLPKVYKMVSHVYDFDYIVTTSEFEALVLECSMIKQHSPKYNILLKDDKGYNYIKVYPNDWGKITAEKTRLDDGAKYIGPYTSSFVVTQTVDEANRVFMLPTCKRKFPQDFGKERPCLYYHIKRCSAPCTGTMPKEEYEETLRQAVKFIEDGGAESIKILGKMMIKASNNLEFEKAAEYRDRIAAIKKIAEHQRVIFCKVESQDVIGFTKTPENSCAVILKFRGGKLVDKISHTMDTVGDLPSTRSEFLVSYYNNCSDFPKQIAIDGEFEDKELITGFISHKTGRNTPITIPLKGEQRRLVEMARDNSAELLAEQSPRSAKELTALDELSRLLGLKEPPQYIEAYDISNIGSQTIVAGMVVFDRGRPLKEAYRKFSVQTVLGTPDDYASMREVISRRLDRYYKHKDEGVGFGRLPDLILLDGGRGHVNAIAPVLKEKKLAIPLFGMVKDNKHHTRAIATDGGEISVASFKSAFTLLNRIQEEVHRYSIGYSRKKHTKSSFELTIGQVEGIGPARIKALYKRFKSLKAMKEATVEELHMANGMSMKAAENLYFFLHKEDVGD